MTKREPPASSPMGRLDAIDVGAKKLTIQTEFFVRPDWHLETKVYLGGELKKVYSDPLEGVSDEQLQQVVNDFHQKWLDEIVAGLRNRT